MEPERLRDARKMISGALLVLLLAYPISAASQQPSGSVSINAKVLAPPEPPTPGPIKVIFKGIAYPDSKVTLQRDGVIAAVVPADPSARFEIEISGLLAGTYTFGIFGEDSLGRVGRTSNFTLSLSPGTTVTLNGIFLGPTIGLDKTSIELGETVTMLGATAPESEVTIFVSSEEEKTFKTKAERSGLWIKQFLGADLGVGTHSARAKAVATGNEISAFSHTVSFAVTERQPPGPPSPPDRCRGKRPGDLNCDGRVNLVDFSIMLFYWKKRNPAHPRVDINKDGIVNIRDLSILLFWWAK